MESWRAASVDGCGPASKTKKREEKEMSRIQVPLYVTNNLGYTIQQCWVNHVTSDPGTGIDKGHATNIPQGGNNPVAWTMTIETKTNDLFTVMWIDPEGNVWGSPPQFSAECSMGGGSVTISLAGGQVTVMQGSATPGSAAFVEYIVAP
jgi:hypothetical protein